MNILAYSAIKLLRIENQIKYTAQRNVIFPPSKKPGASKGHALSATTHIYLRIKNKNIAVMTVARKLMAKNKIALFQFSV